MDITDLFVLLYSIDDDDDVIYVGTFVRNVDTINAAIGNMSIDEVKAEPIIDGVNIGTAVSTDIKVETDIKIEHE